MSSWWILAILLAALKAGAEPAIVVRPHTQVVQNKSIELQDVAEFFEVESNVSSKIGKIKLAEGLSTGERIEFSGTTISTLLRNHRLWSSQKRPAFTIPSRVIVENVGDQITEARVRMELMQRWQSQCGCRIELSELSLPKMEPWLPGTQWQLRFPPQPARGSFTMSLELSHQGTQKTLWLQGRATHFKMSPVARRQINIGERIQPEDYQMAEREVTFSRDAIPSESDLVGRKAKVGIAAQDILLMGQLEREKALRRGDQVKLALSEGPWEITMMGVAEQDGFIGDTVKVRNPKSNQVVVATITGRGEVKAE